MNLGQKGVDIVYPRKMNDSQIRAYIGIGNDGKIPLFNYQMWEKDNEIVVVIREKY